MSERGMKKWAPYKSLVEQEAVLNKAKNNVERVEKPQISNEQAESINEILINYRGERLKVKYYRNYKIHEEEITISRIDNINKKLVLTDNTSIKFNELINLERI